LGIKQEELIEDMFETVEEVLVYGVLGRLRPGGKPFR
jgi:hypothetical protein